MHSKAACFLCLVLAIPPLLFAQSKSTNAVSIPFVGCHSDGQAGPVDAPEGVSKTVAVNQGQAKRLAYYKAGVLDVGVLAPRGWHCIGVYGSSGASLFVVPAPIDERTNLSFAGPAIELDVTDADGSGRYRVAEVIGRAFPAYRDDVKGVLEDIDQKLPPGPFPGDILLYRSDKRVEFKTPVQKAGLGTLSHLLKGDLPIEGVAILLGQRAGLVQLSVRLPKDAESLAQAIIAQCERDASSLGHQ